MNTTSTVDNSIGNSIAIPLRSLAYHVTRTNGSLPSSILRLTLAAVMFPHGAQKLLGWFSGYGFEGTMNFFTGTMGIPWLLSLGVILVEFFAPLLLVLGVGTRPAALSLGTVLASALFMVHAQHGFFMNWFGTQKGEGIEFFLLALGIAAALVVAGGGRWSLDRALCKEHPRIGSRNAEPTSVNRQAKMNTPLDFTRLEG